MTSPQASSTDQILIKLGEISVQLAHIEEQVKPVQDHETRLRALEKTASEQSGGRDTWARIGAGVGTLVGIGGLAAALLHR